MLVAQNLSKFQLIKSPHRNPEKELPLVCRRMNQNDVATMFFALKRNSEHISNHFWWADGIENLGMFTAQNLVQAMLDDDKDHYLFYLGDDIFVGQGTLSPIGGVAEHRQIALWVDEKWINRGLGTRIAATLEKIAFEQDGYRQLYYTHDKNNLASETVAIKLGFEQHCLFESDKLARKDSGYWKCWVKDNPHYQKSLI